MADIKRFSNKSQIENGTQDVNLSLNDILISQHITGDNNDYKLTLAQAQAVPYGVCNSPANEDKTVVFSNYPDGFTAQVGTKILVKFTYGNTKGSVSAGTYPKLTAGGLTGAILAQGKTIANGAIVAGQICELIATPDGWNIDQNTREVTTDYTILSDGSFVYNTSQVSTAINNAGMVKDNSSLGGLKIGYALATMPNAVNTESTYHLAFKPSVVIPLGARVIRKNTTYEYDIYTCGTLLYTSNDYRFRIYVNQDMLQYVGGQPIGILFAYIE